MGRGGNFRCGFFFSDLGARCCPHETWIDQILGLKNKSGMTIPVAFFPYRHNLVDGDVADVVLVILELHYGIFDLDDFAAQAGRAGADNVNFLVNQFGK